ncbi:MAG TPA: helix-turn-helix transcriptional regulator [Firmicutes bacterium]|nr:helix-turn-helix transcriptional regulator [Bacillota bacterium]
MCGCGLKETLEATMNLFYACTRLPITAVTKEDCKKCKRQNQVGMGPVDYPAGEIALPGGRSLYTCPICPHGGRAGIFLLGPYSTAERDQNYRPKDAFPHLIALLRNLQAGCAVTREKTPYCLHVHRAVEMIKTQYNQEITLAGTAESLGLNKSYLSTLFREQTGRTFTDYVHDVRIAESKKLLEGTSLSILDIALQVGFANQNYFSRIFKKLTGITPSEFRRRIRKTVRL